MGVRFDRQKFREARGALTQSAYARVIGTSERNIIRWERGEHVPTERSVARVARATGKPKSFFYSDDEAAA